LQEILSESQDPVVADRRIPEAEDVSGVVEMRYTKYWWDETAGSATAPVVNLKKRSPFIDPHYRRLAIAAHCQRLMEALDDGEWGSPSAKKEIDRFSKMRFPSHDLKIEAARFRKLNEWLTTELFRESAYVVQGSSVLLVPLDLSMEDVYHPGYILLQDAEVTLSLRDVNGRQHHFKDVGSGIAFVLPVLVCLTFDGIRFIQQPELHLHPALQSALADVFIDAMKTSQSQTIVETHSEHFLLRLLRRIRRTEHGKETAYQLLPESVAVYYFDPQVNGESIVTRQFITPLGDFYNDWPRGFFADRDQDLLDGRI